jgi:MYXO-CTERM domain-containing protein
MTTPGGDNPGSGPATTAHRVRDDGTPCPGRRRTVSGTTPLAYRARPRPDSWEEERMKWTHQPRRGVGVAAALLLAALPATAQTSYGPTPYLQFADRPAAFQGGFSSYFLENFEDATLTPGWTANNGGRTSVVFGATLHDSVDADDGAIDGSGLGGDSWFSSQGTVTFTFNAAAFGGQLPTHVGIVWTDGANTISFEARDAANIVIASLAGNHADGSSNGETAEDRFYGVSNPGGVLSITVSNPGGIELDHLQYGFTGGGTANGPEPGTFALLALGAVAARRYRRR